MYVIGLDVGTMGSKAIVADKSGKIFGSGYREYDLMSLPGGRVSNARRIGLKPPHMPFARRAKI